MRPKSETTYEFSKPSWHEIRLDIVADIEPDIVASITDLGVVPDNSVDAVYCSHLLEHLHAHQLALALQECCRVLRPDGFMLIRCPNLKEIARLIMEDQLHATIYRTNTGIPVTAHDMIYGHTEFIKRGHIEMAHKCGFTPVSIAEMMRHAGFQSVLTAVNGQHGAQLEIWCYASREDVSEGFMQDAILAHSNAPIATDQFMPKTA